MKIIITRHGETEGNKADIVQGHLHGVLSELGKEQAGKLAERLKDEKIDLIISSDLNRAHDTAKAIAKYHPGVKLITDERLRERHLGRFQGKSRSIIDWNNLPGDVETREKMQTRILELLNETLKKYHGETVVFVAHAGINNALIKKILQEKPDADLNWRDQDNTCVNILDVDKDGKIEIKLLNCTEHLG